MGRQPFFHDGVRIELAREEEATRAPTRSDVVALLTTSPFPAEHCNPVGIAATFSFGEVLEIYPVSLMGDDMSFVRTVVLVKRTCDIPCDIWPIRRPWPTRIVQIRVVRVWAASESFRADRYQRFFRPPPPPPFRHNRLAFRGRLPAPAHLSSRGSQLSGGGSVASGMQHSDHANHATLATLLLLHGVGALALHHPPRLGRASPTASSPLRPCRLVTGSLWAPAPRAPLGPPLRRVATPW
jgi:hypothetical protein